MKYFDYFYFLAQISHSQLIVRRYLITNGFDAVFTMLGLNMGFYVSGSVELQLAFHASFGAGIALAMSGLSSAYISESAERSKSLAELEQAMIMNLEQTSQGKAAKFIPIWIAFINGFFPLILVALISAPLWLTLQQWWIFVYPIPSAIIISFVSLFCLGIYGGIISGTSVWWSGFRTLFIGLVIAIIVVTLT